MIFRDSSQNVTNANFLKIPQSLPGWADIRSETIIFIDWKGGEGLCRKCRRPEGPPRAAKKQKTDKRQVHGVVRDLRK